MNMKQRLDDLLTAGVKNGHVPGVVAALVDKNGQTYLGSAGERTVGTGDVMTTDTVGAIASMTKAITGAAVMQLAEQGRLDLDAPAETYCAELASPQVLEGFDDDGQPILRDARSQVTLRNLLTHTSGYAYDFTDPNLDKWFGSTNAPRMSTGRVASLNTPLMFDPGTRWHYGIGIDWAGRILEHVTKSKLGDYFAEHLLEPLGMVDTGFTCTPNMLERKAALHLRTPDSSFMSFQMPRAEKSEFESGGGGLFSTMNDYTRFMRMILNDGEFEGVRVLGAETIAQMATNNMGDIRVTELKSANPAFFSDGEFYPGVPKTWGLTFLINEEPLPNGCPAGALTWAGAFNSYFWIDRTTGIAGCYMSQVLPFIDAQTSGHFFDFQTAAYAS
jgi:CubicO group peptidase (beta-lactamase class C family)